MRTRSGSKPRSASSENARCGYAGHAWPAYPQRAFSELADLGLEPDLVLIHGRFRVACLPPSVLAAPAGTRVLFDDYIGRSKYHVVERFTPVAELVDRAA